MALLDPVDATAFGTGFIETCRSWVERSALSRDLSRNGASGHSSRVDLFGQRATTGGHYIARSATRSMPNEGYFLLVRAHLHHLPALRVTTRIRDLHLVGPVRKATQIDR